jgi:hypothetical protein
MRAQERQALLDHIEKRPESMWKIGTMWSFRNEAKVYGSPMFDAMWAQCHDGAPPDPMPAMLRKLRSAPLPSGAFAGKQESQDD